jgi:6-phosphofructokinase 1
MQENLDFSIKRLGECKIDSPLNLSSIIGDNKTNYVEDSSKIIYNIDLNHITECFKNSLEPLSFEMAGPRKKIFFDPSKTKVAIVTCGGLCPGLNDVIRSLVMELYYKYEIKKIYGMRYGFQGFIPKYKLEPMDLTPQNVSNIHELGGTILSSSRGHQDIDKIVDCLENLDIKILFSIGGDGTLRATHEICNEIERRKLKISVIGIPKTIDNDIMYVKKTFGLETAFTEASRAIRSAHVEAKGAPRGVGLVKLMGRHSGFIAANAAIAMKDVNVVLVPEMDFDLEGENGLFNYIDKRMKESNHIVIVVAEGAGQNFFNKEIEKDASGNTKLNDIGIFLRDSIKNYFKFEKKEPINMKYIDPSYIIRSSKATPNDSIFCTRLAQNAVHAAMTGRTDMIVGLWHQVFTHIPISAAISKRNVLDLESQLWLNVISATGQPNCFKNDKHC